MYLQRLCFLFFFFFFFLCVLSLMSAIGPEMTGGVYIHLT